MEIRLSAELAAVVHEDLKAGSHQGIEDYLADAIESLHERYQALGETPEEAREKMAVAWQEAQRGELMSEEDFLAERKMKKAAWLSLHQSA